MEVESTPARLRRIFATIICFNQPSDVPKLLINFTDKLSEDIVDELRYFDINFENEMLIQLVVVLIEVELGEMDIELSNTRRFGLQNLSDAQRQQTLEVLDLLKRAKQGEESYLKSSGNPYTNIISVPVLQKFCDQKHVLTREQSRVLEHAEASIRENRQFCAIINADAGCGKTFTLNTLIARLIHIHRV